MHYYPHHIGDFRSGTVNMSRQERWLYRDMLDIIYDTEKPLPDSLEKICSMLGARTEEERKIVAELLLYKFVQVEGGYMNERAKQEIENYRQKAETARANGKSGGRPRKPEQAAEDSEPKPSGFPSGSDPQPTGIPVESGSKTNHEPITSFKKPLSGKPDALAILEHLNEAAGRRYRPVKANLSLIAARLAEGSTPEECRAVIDAKVAAWSGDPRMRDYLRPETLFGATKFAGYVGQLGSIPQAGKDWE